jgi:YggT family protein
MAAILIMFVNIANYLLGILGLIILADCIISTLISFNVINTYNGFVAGLARGLATICAPVYRPLRRILPNTNPLDLAPFAALILIKITQAFVLPTMAGFIPAY